MVLQTCLGIGRGTEPPWHPLVASPLPLLSPSQETLSTIETNAGKYDSRAVCCHPAVVDELNTWFRFSTCCRR